MPSIVFSEEPAKKSVTERTHLEEGEYQLRVKDYEFKTSKNGNEMIRLQLEEVNSKNYIWDYLVFTPKAQFKIKQFLPALGKDVGAKVDMDESFMNGIIGEHLWAELVTDTYEGKTSNKVGSYLEGKERLPKQVIDDEDVPSWNVD
tara:strand:- start:5672 stop:6109 length:438 start_codon:yes stop_codon:yes gene_type:complete